MTDRTLTESVEKEKMYPIVIAKQMNLTKVDVFFITARKSALDIVSLRSFLYAFITLIRVYTLLRLRVKFEICASICPRNTMFFNVFRI